MKKLYILFLLLTPFFVSAQTFDFKNSGTDDLGWIKSGSGANTSGMVSGEGFKLTWLQNQPKIRSTAAAVDADINKYLEITLVNNSIQANTLKIVFTDGTDNVGTKTLQFSIDPAPVADGGSSKTYYVDLSAVTGWNNFSPATSIDAIDFVVSDNNTNMTSGPETNIIFEKIVFTNQKPEKVEYNFDTDGDAEGWDDVDVSSVVASDVITITPTAGQSSKIVQNTYKIDPANATWMHITYQNLSTLNNQFRIQWILSGDTYKGANINISSGMTSFETASYDLSSKGVDWSTAEGTKFQISIRNTLNSGNVSSAGDMVIDRIVFNNSSTLNIDKVDFKDDTTISVYPNPVQNVLKINAPNAIDKIEVYNILGQKILDHKGTNQINVESLSKGMYISKIFMEGDVISTKRFFKD